MYENRAGSRDEDNRVETARETKMKEEKQEQQRTTREECSGVFLRVDGPAENHGSHENHGKERPHDRVPRTADGLAKNSKWGERLAGASAAKGEGTGRRCVCVCVCVFENLGTQLAGTRVSPDGIAAKKKQARALPASVKKKRLRVETEQDGGEEGEEVLGAAREAGEVGKGWI